MFDKGTKGLPPTMKNVRFLMTTFHQKDIQVTEHFAEGYIKAGYQGEPSGFYKITAENRLTGEDIRELFFGRKVTGFKILELAKACRIISVIVDDILIVVKETKIADIWPIGKILLTISTRISCTKDIVFVFHYE